MVKIGVHPRIHVVDKSIGLYCNQAFINLMVSVLFVLLMPEILQPFFRYCHLRVQPLMRSVASVCKCVCVYVSVCPVCALSFDCLQRQ